MNPIDWIQDFTGAVTLCDTHGIILEMNKAAEKVFASDGGRSLIGSNALDCHPLPAREKMQMLLASQGINVYTIEKNGKTKLIYQSPWYKDGVFAGLVELSLELPAELPHFIRK